MSSSYDVVVVGGGIAGASLACRLAGAGVRVLVVETTRAFRDRVRGEVLYPWGVREARRLGVLGAMLAGPARELPYWRTRFSGFPAAPARDLKAETGEAALTFFHPALQEALLSAAAEAGATVWRGARAAGVERTATGATVTVREGGATREVAAALVVGADGRGSALRRGAGFEVRRDRERLVFAGLLLTGAAVEPTQRPADTAQLYFGLTDGLLAMLLPLGDGLTRAYAGYHLATGRRPEVGASREEFFALARAAGAPAAAFADAAPAGLLAAFDGADRWVDAPYAAGVALVGDAAAASDPSFGCGLALTLVGVRLLAESLLEQPDLAPAAVERAGAAYAAAFGAAYGSLHRQIDWLTEFYRTPGPEADALRARLFPLHAEEPWRLPDVVGVGPDAPSDEAARRAFLGLDRAEGGA